MSGKGGRDFVCDVSYRKKAGKLTLTTKGVTWIPADRTASVEIPFEAVKGQAQNKGSDKVILKITTFPAGPGQPEVNHNITFLAPDELENRRTIVEAISAAVARRVAAAAAGSEPGSRSSTPVARSVAKIPSLSADMQVRIAVLNENAELRQLHTTLVINGPLSEEDFWSQRQHMLEYQKWQRSQKRGQQGTVVNVRPAEGEGSDVKFVFNDDIVASILSQFPPVRKAYEATVSTGKVSKETFLRMFLESKYYNRKSLPDAKAADEFFSKYEDEDDDDYVLNPKTALYESNNYLLDLQAQIEDHGHTGNTPDPTMRPGGVKAALPLIRQFNRVSEGVLNANKRPIAKSTKRPQADDVYRDATELEDLVIKPPPARRPLEIRDSSGYFSQASVSDTNIAVQDAQSMVESFNDRVLQWQLNLPNAPIDRHHSGKVLENVSATVKKRKLSLAVSTDIKVSAQIHTTHLALVELLRNFWTAKAQKQDQKMTQIATTMRTMMKAASSLEDESHGKFFAGIRESFQKALQSA